jgi:hypothetical protein
MMLICQPNFTIDIAPCFVLQADQYPGLKITAGQRTMSGQNPKLSGQIFALPVILTGWVTCVFIYAFKSLASCN